jgi:uncharacterized membrane protein HdeD (DUF308 family)
MYFYGGVLVVAAAIECVNAFMVGRWSGFFLHLLGVLLFGVIGFLLLRHPIISAESLMAIYFIVGGTFEVIAPLFMRMPDTGWHVLNGAISVLLGILVRTVADFRCGQSEPSSALTCYSTESPGRPLRGASGC